MEMSATPLRCELLAIGDFVFFVLSTAYPVQQGMVQVYAEIHVLTGSIFILQLFLHSSCNYLLVLKSINYQITIAG